MKRSTSRVAGGKVKVNDNGEMYIERRGRKPGNGKTKRSRGNNTTLSSGPRSGAISNRRTSARSRRVANINTPLETLVRKYASRRSILFKSNRPNRSQSAKTLLIPRYSVWYKHVFYKIGDIIAMKDKDDMQDYFAQIRGIITDPFVKHHLAVTWLIPKRSALSPHLFEAEHFAHGVVDRVNYPIEVCRWICNRPSLSSYHKEWTPQDTIASQKRQDIIRRINILTSIATEEFASKDTVPIIELTGRKNSEPR